MPPAEGEREREKRGRIDFFFPERRCLKKPAEGKEEEKERKGPDAGDGGDGGGGKRRRRKGEERTWRHSVERRGSS